MYFTLVLNRLIVIALYVSIVTSFYHRRRVQATLGTFCILNTHIPLIHKVRSPSQIQMHVCFLLTFRLLYCGKCHFSDIQVAFIPSLDLVLAASTSERVSQTRRAGMGHESLWDHNWRCSPETVMKIDIVHRNTNASLLPIQSQFWIVN
jgi:hypothetical protein